MLHHSVTMVWHDLSEALCVKEHAYVKREWAAPSPLNAADVPGYGRATAAKAASLERSDGTAEAVPFHGIRLEYL